MVSFICNACGQTVRKAQVEKHYQNECHDCNVLSCIDCGKDFHGDEYAGHTSCMTEAEKYQGKLYKPKDKQNKGEHKQQEWLKQIREATKTDVVEPRLAALLDRISEYSNIPRKKAKFQNFCRNSINVRDVTTLDKLWDIFSASSKQSPQQDETSCSSNGIHENGKSGLTSPLEENVDVNIICGEEIRVNEENRELEQKSEDSSNAKHSKKHKKGEKMKDNDIHEIGSEFKGRKNKKGLKENTEVDGLKENKKQKKKRRREDEEIDEPYTQAKVTKVETEDAKEQPYQFKWKSVIKAVLRQAPDQELPIKRLRKKVLAEYQAKGTNEKNLTDNELRALFQKKVSSNPKFKVHKDRVRLVK